MLNIIDFLALIQNKIKFLLIQNYKELYKRNIIF